MTAAVQQGRDAGRRAVVLAGGGVAGIAWELGVLQGIHDVDPGTYRALRDADVIVGTSAGSVVAAQMSSAVSLAELYAAQLRPEHREIEVDLAWEALMARFAGIAAGATGVGALRRSIGALDPVIRVDQGERRRTIAARLPVPHWPDREIRVTAVDADSGELVAFDHRSDVALVDAVAASCAVPCVWPPVVIAGRRYIDGSVPSGTNLHLAEGCDGVLVITPTPPGPPAPATVLPEELECLTTMDTLWVHADAASLAAFGPNPLSPDTRGPAARTGRAAGRRAAGQVAAFWRRRRRR